MFKNLPATSEKNRSPDRILVLETVGKKADSGVITNTLHAILDENSLWFLRFEHGSLPGSFQQRFTSFSALLKHVKDYYAKKDIVVKEVID